MEQALRGQQMISRFILIGFSALSVAACSGTVVMSPFKPADLNKDFDSPVTQENPSSKDIEKNPPPEDITGIIVYRPKTVVEVDRFTQYNKPDPAKAGATIASGECNRIPVRKIVTIPDLEHPYRLHYDHGFLESYTFGATMTGDGILTAFNSQSTPDQGKTLQNIASAAVSAASIKATKPGKLPDCTITPTFDSYELLPGSKDIKPFGSAKRPDAVE